MTTIEAIILGVVEGLTEFLPISSTAHLIFTSRLLDLENTEFLKTFEISIQLGAILAVLFLYRQKILKGWEINKRLLVAFLPTALIGALAYPVVKGIFFANHLVSVSALFVGGVVIILLERWLRARPPAITTLATIDYRRAVYIGLCQALAIIPGVSRAAATIMGGRALGLDRKTIVEFSFLLAVPTMLGAVGFDFLQSVPALAWSEYLNLAVGFSVSFVAASLGIKFFLKFITIHDLTVFGVYRVLLALIFLLYTVWHG